MQIVLMILNYGWMLPVARQCKFIGISSCDFRLWLTVTLLPFLSTCVSILKLHNILNEFANMILPKFQKDDEKEIMNQTQNLFYYIVIATVFCQW